MADAALQPLRDAAAARWGELSLVELYRLRSKLWLAGDPWDDGGWLSDRITSLVPADPVEALGVWWKAFPEAWEEFQSGTSDVTERLAAHGIPSKPVVAAVAETEGVERQRRSFFRSTACFGFEYGERVRW